MHRTAEEFGGVQCHHVSECERDFPPFLQFASFLQLMEHFVLRPATVTKLTLPRKIVNSDYARYFDFASNSPN
jgi:hypothetical protein